MFFIVIVGAPPLYPEQREGGARAGPCNAQRNAHNANALQVTFRRIWAMGQQYK